MNEGENTCIGVFITFTNIVKNKPTNQPTPKELGSKPGRISLIITGASTVDYLPPTAFEIDTTDQIKSSYNPRICYLHSEKSG